MTDKLPDVKSINEFLKQKAIKNVKDTPYLKTKLMFKEKVKAIIPILKSTIGEEIPLEQQIKRLNTCSECENLTLINEKPACGICGCSLQIDDKSLINLVSKKETKNYGCKIGEWIKNKC